MLSKKLAQSIANKMMEIIPYNINIMNDKGIIIASGDLDRIGFLHEGALESLNKKKMIEVYKETSYMKKGVNTPIFFRENIIGVIGITGDPKEVKGFSKIVSVTAELLIKQEYSMNEYMLKKKLKEEYIYELLYSNNEYNNEFIQRGKILGIDITKDRRVIVLQFNKEKGDSIKHFLERILSLEEIFINISDNKLAIILLDTFSLNEKIRRILNLLRDFDVKIGIGNCDKKIQNSFVQAIEALNIGIKLCSEENIYIYQKLKLFYHMEELFLQRDNKEIRDKIEKEDKELLKTFITYFNTNRSKNKTSDLLHIHRNTLTYRLKRIEDITGLSFENDIDLFQYISSYIGYKLSEDYCANE